MLLLQCYASHLFKKAHSKKNEADPIPFYLLVCCAIFLWALFWL